MHSPTGTKKLGNHSERRSSLHSLSSVVFFGSPAKQRTATVTAAAAAAEMGPPKSGRSISQQAFDEMVKENIDDLGMDPSKPSKASDGSVKDNPVIQSLDRLKQLNSDSTDRIGDQNDVDEVIVLLDKLVDLCSIEGSGNAAIAMNPDFFRIDDGSSDRLNLGFLMEPCDAKLWEARYPMSPFEDFDFVSTGNMIEEIFGPNTETSKLSDKRKALDSGSSDDHLN
ncbi:unnamed protein product [Camellia sinensis]